MKLNYRADIDGLRAIAVLSVVLNHAGIPLFTGGFIGVDVFFVISGYLITNIIWREMDTENFSLKKFYERRIRRIYPALFAVIFFTTIASAVLYDSDNLSDFGRSLIATTFFFSNIHFWNETGYFESPAQLKPLLHTWSLAVEEQYYIIFPLLMLGLNRYVKPKISQALGILIALSFCWNIYELQNDASGAFYFAHLRAWELLLGGLLALNPISLSAKPIFRNILGLLGLGMIIAPVFLYSENTVFPGVAAAVPVLGTLLIIYCGAGSYTLVNTLLSASPLVFIGKISYSLYLWHWPIIIFGKYYAIKPLDAQETTGLLIILFIVSLLSWQFIESPFRKTKISNNYGVFFYASSVMAISLITGFIIYFNDGFRSFQPSAGEEDRKWPMHCEYGKPSYENADLPKGCPLGARKENPSFLLWGDSFGLALSEGVSLSASKHNLKGYLVYSSGCAPVLGVEREGFYCINNNNAIIKYIEKHPELKTIILVSRWTLWTEGSFYYFTEKKKNITLIEGLPESSQPQTYISIVKRGLERTIRKLHELDRHVIIISQVPEIGYDVPSANFIAQRTARNVNDIVGLPLSDYLQRSQKTIVMLNSLSKNMGIEILEPQKILCNEAQCLAAINGKLLYMDDYHLSVFGSKYIFKIYDTLFEKNANNQK